MSKQRKRYVLMETKTVGDRTFFAGEAYLTDDEARQLGLETGSGTEIEAEQSKFPTSQEKAEGQVSGDQTAAQSSGSAEGAGNAGGDTPPSGSGGESVSTSTSAGTGGEPAGGAKTGGDSKEGPGAGAGSKGEKSK